MVDYDQYELFYTQKELEKIVSEEAWTNVLIGGVIGTILTVIVGVILNSLGLLCA